MLIYISFVYKLNIMIKQGSVINCIQYFKINLCMCGNNYLNLMSF